MPLRKFSDRVAAKQVATIRAEDLDKNFSYVSPRTVDGDNPQYRIDQTDAGWRLIIFPDFPEGQSGPSVLTYGVDGSGMQWLSMRDLLAFIFDEEIDLYEVERCDGKRMKVLGTAWADPA